MLWSSVVFARVFIIGDISRQRMNGVVNPPPRKLRWVLSDSLQPNISFPNGLCPLPSFLPRARGPCRLCLARARQQTLNVNLDFLSCIFSKSGETLISYFLIYPLSISNRRSSCSFVPAVCVPICVPACLPACQPAPSSSLRLCHMT